MPVSKVELIGGSFQDSEGNLLSGGYLWLKLSQDENVNDVEVCSGVEVKILLDQYGSVIGGQFVWGNDQMLPVNSFYKVTGYTAAGQPAWGPNNQQVNGNGGTFDVGTWVPNQVISWVPPLQPLTLEVNGTPLAAPQTLLNLTNSPTVTFVNNGGGSISAIASSATVLSTAGQSLFTSGQLFSSPDPSYFAPFAPTNTADVVGFCYLNLFAQYTVRAVATRVQSGTGDPTTFAFCAIYTPDGSTKLLEAGFNTQNGASNQAEILGSPVVIGPGSYLFAWGGNANNTGQSGTGHDLTGNAFINSINSVQTMAGIAANPIVAGVMPSSLGVLTAVNTFNIPTFIFLV